LEDHGILLGHGGRGGVPKYFVKKQNLHSLRAAFFDRTDRGALSPPHTSRTVGWAQIRVGNSGTCPRQRFGAAPGSYQDRMQLRQTYSGRSASVATRPESRPAPPRPAPHFQSSLGDDCQLPAMIRLTGGYARAAMAYDLDYSRCTLSL
jgi:hypothetical protein